MALCTQPTGAAVSEVRISAYNVTGELDIRSDPFTLGTRILLTCNVTGLPGTVRQSTTGGIATAQ